MKIIGRRKGMPLIQLPPFGRARITQLSVADAVTYQIETTRAGEDKRFKVFAKTTLEPELWDETFCRSVAMTIGVTEDEVWRALWEFLGEETEN